VTVKGMHDLPTGTVTFLFTDIEGSTKLLHELGDAYADALAEHRRALREGFGRHGGVEVDTQGDAFFYAFARATDAVAAAQAGQQALQGPIHVRMGLHTGEPLATDEGYVGVDVHLGARIAAAAHGGQVLLSPTTRELVDGFAVVDLGKHRVKDFDEPLSIFQLGDGAFPPLKTISNTNLPRPASTFVGREREVAAVTELVRGGARLVTLTGPGGSGKTRLALEAAAELVGQFDAGVFWVPLATVSDPALVLQSVAQTLGADANLAGHVGDRQLLLLLDNLEHVIAVAPELAALVEACPNLVLLVTSRQLLRVRAELEYEVLPLAEPDAVALFCSRAQVPPTEAVEELCRRLDNMPLALELAAARARVLSVEQIVDRLSRRLDLFKGGRDADPRQQTLRATIEWSHALLDGEEQRLFARLAVFPGGCTVAAAEQVVDADLDVLQSLVEKSLLRRTEDRFWMLETIREYAVERLEASGEGDALRRRHAEWSLEVVEAANLSIDALGRAPQRHDEVATEQANLRAALDWATATDVELALRLLVGLENFWVTRDATEGLRRFEAALARAERVETPLLARAYRDYGGMAQLSTRHELACELYERSRELFAEAGEESGVATATFRIGVAAQMAGDFETARRLYAESQAIFGRVGDAIGECQVLGNLGDLELEHGDPDLGRRLAERSLEIGRKAGWTWWVSIQLINLAEYELAHGSIDEGERLARDALELCQTMGDRRHAVYCMAQLAWAASRRGDEERAALLWHATEAETERARLMGLTVGELGRYRERISPRARAEPPLPFDQAIEAALAA
jgi:predicted ATPase/class 3 adenylate cyclase